MAVKVTLLMQAKASGIKQTGRLIGKVDLSQDHRHNLRRETVKGCTCHFKG